MPPYPLPLFPLHVVLFPGTPLPLHIFEPRYRRLLADCAAGNRRFGILPPEADQEVPRSGTVGCIADIRANEALPDGRANIIVTGGERFVLRRILEDPAPYRVGLVEEFGERPGTGPAPEALSDLRGLFARYYELYRQLHEVEAENPDLPGDAVPFTFAVSAALECDMGLKQRLLTTRSTRDRVGLLLQIVPMLSRAIEAALVVHRGARRNGKGSVGSVVPFEP